MILLPTAKERGRCSRLAKNVYWLSLSKAPLEIQQSFKFSFLWKKNSAEVKLVCCRSRTKEQTDNSQLSTNQPFFFPLKSSK
jgi:hypothetical protein